MLGKKNKEQYSYKPSYLFKKGSKYADLVLNYNEIFIKIIKDGIESLSSEEKEKFFLGLSEIKYYIYGSFFYSVKEKYENKQNSEKIISAIYHRYVAFLGSEKKVKEEISDDIMDLAERSIYYTLGIETYKNRNFKWNPEDSYYTNFLKHSIKIPFSELVFLKMKEINIFLDFQKQEVIEYYEEDLNSGSVENIREKAYELIRNSGIEQYIPELVYHRLIDYLSGDIDLKDLTEGDIKYLKKIYEGNNK